MFLTLPDVRPGRGALATFSQQLNNKPVLAGEISVGESLGIFFLKGTKGFCRYLDPGSRSRSWEQCRDNLVGESPILRCRRSCPYSYYMVQLSSWAGWGMLGSLLVRIGYGALLQASGALTAGAERVVFRMVSAAPRGQELGNSGPSVCL